MQYNRALIQAIEQSGDRVTVADVAAKSGLSLDLAQRDLLALAAAIGGNLEVAESGDLVYRFPRNILGILRTQSWRLRLQQTWEKVWGVLFYLIRISFGIILIASLVIIIVAIIAIAIAAMAASSNRDSDSDADSGGGSGLEIARLLLYVNYWIGPDWYWWLLPWGNDSYAGFDDRTIARRRRSRDRPGKKLSFLEAILSFLFGDGDPNANIEGRRWQAIATVIRNQGGAVAAEQITPYLDAAERDDEDFMLPVLVRFNGYPEATDQGELVYAFPDLQVTASEETVEPVRSYLHEAPWEFSAATRGQLGWALGLGFANLSGAVLLGWLLWFQGAVEWAGSFVAGVAPIYTEVVPKLGHDAWLNPCDHQAFCRIGHYD